MCEITVSIRIGSDIRRAGPTVGERIRGAVEPCCKGRKKIARRIRGNKRHSVTRNTTKSLLRIVNYDNQSYALKRSERGCYSAARSSGDELCQQIAAFVKQLQSWRQT
jgi:phage gp37-like protein